MRSESRQNWPDRKICPPDDPGTAPLKSEAYVPSDNCKVPDSRRYSRRPDGCGLTAPRSPRRLRLPSIDFSSCITLPCHSWRPSGRPLNSRCYFPALKSVILFVPPAAHPGRHLVDQAGHIHAVLDRLIQNKRYLRRISQVDPPGKLRADKSHGVFKALYGILSCLFISQYADVSLAELQIRSYLHGDDGRHRVDPRIFELPADDFAQLSLNLAVDSCILNAVLAHRIASLSGRKRGLSGHLHHRICLDQVVFLEIIELLKYKAALISGVDFLYIILKPL